MRKETQPPIDIWSYAAFIMAIEKCFEKKRRSIFDIAVDRYLSIANGLGIPLKPWARILRIEARKFKDVDAVVLEFGVYKGNSINFLSSTLPCANIHGFDSFCGFPQDGRTDWDQDFSLPIVPYLRRNITLHKGFFEETLPSFVKSHKQLLMNKPLLIHVDCDIYSSTHTIFENISPVLRPGVVIVFDEILNYREFAVNEILAFYLFLQRSVLDAKWSTVIGSVWPTSSIDSATSYDAMREMRSHGFFQNQSIVLCESDIDSFKRVASSLDPSPSFVRTLADIISASGFSVV